MATKIKRATYVLTASAAVALTCPANKALVISKALCCNTSTSAARLVSIWAGASAIDGTAVLVDQSIFEKTTESLVLPGLILENGDNLYAKVDNATDEVVLTLGYTIVDQTP
jgi:hypothetical protein